MNWKDWLKQRSANICSQRNPNIGQPRANNKVSLNFGGKKKKGHLHGEHINIREA